MKLREAAQQALAAWDQPHGINYVDFRPYMDALRAALAEPVEAVAIVGTREGTWKGYEGQWLPPGPPIKTVHMLRDLPQGTPLYTSPPKRKPLTDEEMRQLWAQHGYKSSLCMRFARAVERAHGIGGGNE